MDAKSFIINELNRFIKNFSKTRLRYEFDKNALVHVVEIMPNEIYHLDNDYIHWENDLYSRFVSQFPMENICFISDDAVVGIENPELVLEGLEYAPFSIGQAINLYSTIVTQVLNYPYDNFTSRSEDQKKETYRTFDTTDIPNTYLSKILQAA